MTAPLRPGDMVEVNDPDFESGAVWEILELHSPGGSTAAIPTASLRHAQRPTIMRYVALERLTRIRRVAE